jgi:hypothetical protein
MPELAWAVQSGGGAGQRGGGFAARQSGQTTAGSSLYRFLVGYSVSHVFYTEHTDLTVHSRFVNPSSEFLLICAAAVGHASGTGARVKGPRPPNSRNCIAVGRTGMHLSPLDRGSETVKLCAATWTVHLRRHRHTLQFYSLAAAIVRVEACTIHACI